MDKIERMQHVYEALQKTRFPQMPSFAHPSLKHRGGLLQHSLNFWLQLESLTEKMKLEWSHPSSPFVIAMLHHLCEMEQYNYNPDYQCWEETGSIRGHGSRSLEIATELGIELTEEEQMCILYHMGDFVESTLWEFYADAARAYPNVLWTHTADLMTNNYYGGLTHEK